MLFIENKYSRIYSDIVLRGKTRTLPEDVYTEKHHIIPRSMGGGEDMVNIVVLTAREHFICHILLIKMTTGSHKRAMIFAAKAMTRQKSKVQLRNYKVTSRIYAMLKRLDSAEKRISMKGNTPWNKGKTFKRVNRTYLVHSEETKSKMALRAKTREIKRCKHCGKSAAGSNFSRWHNDNCSVYTGKPHIATNKGMPMSVKQREQLKELAKNRAKIKCDNCGIETTKPNHIRWHGDKCKQLNTH